jgi:hypothetical protein
VSNIDWLDEGYERRMVSDSIELKGKATEAGGKRLEQGGGEFKSVKIRGRYNASGKSI